MKNNYKTTRTAPQISKEEISAMQDFGEILAKKEALLTASAAMMLKVKLIFGTLFLASCGAVLYYFSQTQTPVNEQLANNSSQHKKQLLPTNKQKKTVSFSSSDKEKKEVVLSVKKEIVENKIVVKKKKKVAKMIVPKQKKENQIAEKEVLKTEIPQAKKVVYKKAQPQNGFTVFYEQLSNKLKYPEEVKPLKIEGNVLLKFSISENGEIFDVKVVKSLEPRLDAEAIRVLQEMPAWIPATYGGENIKSTLKIPIQFHIE